jgi:hypothetical protein
MIVIVIAIIKHNINLSVSAELVIVPRFACSALAFSFLDETNERVLKTKLSKTTA